MVSYLQQHSIKKKKIESQFFESMLGVAYTFNLSTRDRQV